MIALHFVGELMKVQRQQAAPTQRRMTVVGVFDDRPLAGQAVRELCRAGFGEKQIGVVLRYDQGPTAHVAIDHDHHGAIRALTGLGVGAVAGVGVLAAVIPVLGPALATGPLGVMLSSAAAGAGIAGLVGALVGAGVPEHEANYYWQEFEAGHTIVTVAAGSRSYEAKAILRRHGSYDMTSGIFSPRVD
jgi:hypothetical protein